MQGRRDQQLGRAAVSRSWRTRRRRRRPAPRPRRRPYGGVVVDDGEVVVVRLNDDGAPDAYAVLAGDVVTDLDDATAETSVGAVWTYYDAADDGAIVVVASSNDGIGVLSLDTPFAVPDACWNRARRTTRRGHDAAGHV